MIETTDLIVIGVGYLIGFILGLLRGLNSGKQKFWKMPGASWGSRK